MLAIEYREIPYAPNDVWIHVEKRNKPETDIIVEAIDWSQSKERLITYSAATCIVLAAYNASSREGTLGHFMTIQRRKLEEEPFNEMLDTIPLLGDVAMTHIWLGAGAAHFSEQFYDEAVARRAVAYDRVHALGVGRLDMQWLEEGEEAMHVGLDVPNAHLLVRTELSP